MLHLDQASSLAAAESVRVEFVRFENDVEKAAEAVEHSPLPNVYAVALRAAQ